jgi:hypothetical protein
MSDNTLVKRNILFLVGCIGARSLITYVAKRVCDDPVLREKYLPMLGMVALIPAIGFTYIFLTDSRQTGPEVFGGKIWWNNFRPIHAALYAIFALFAIKKHPYAWVALAADVGLGLSAFAYNRMGQ